jgi:RNA polymerase sigma factor (sigma-70 family)
MQQTYADAFRSIGQFVPLGDGAFRAWLSSLADYNLRDALRMLKAKKRGGGRKRVGNDPSSDSYGDLLNILSDSGTSPSGRAARVEGASALEDAISSMPDVYQAVVRLFDLECRPIAAVAQEIQRSPGAVYMLRARAHDKLRRILGETGKFFTDSP